MKEIFALYIIVYIVTRCMPVKSYQPYAKFYGGLAVVAMVVTLILKSFGVNGYFDGLIGKYQTILNQNKESMNASVIEQSIENSINSMLLVKDFKLVNCRLTIFNNEAEDNTIHISRMNLVVSRTNSSDEVTKKELDSIKKELGKNYNVDESNISISWRRKT